MDINDFRALATVLVVIAFAGVVWWAYGPGSKHRFDKAENLPFADNDDEPEDSKGNDQ